MDFYLGQVTRDHEDIDWFVWQKDLPGISELLISRDWVDLASHPLDQQRDLFRDEVELGIAPLARTNCGDVVVGGGPFMGEPWPKNMIGNIVLGSWKVSAAPSSAQSHRSKSNV